MTHVLESMVLLLAAVPQAGESPEVSTAPATRMKAPDFKLLSVGADQPRQVRVAFTRRMTVFGIEVLGTARTAQTKMRHAAAIMAGYLDNDRDGAVDNPRVVAAMVRQKSTLVMFATEREAERLERTLPDSWRDSRAAAALFAEETHPDGGRQRRFDATYEEVFHLITHAGYAEAYPGVFGLRPGSQLANAMDKARGGRFLRVPRRYPRSAWFTYDDRTCDYACQCTEYLYWAITSILGAQQAKHRREEISHEWKLHSRELVRTRDPNIFKLITDAKYKLPTRLPDGKYRGQ